MNPMISNGQRVGRTTVLDQSTRSEKLTGHLVVAGGLAGAWLLGLVRARTLSGSVFLRTGEILKHRGDARCLMRAVQFFGKARATFAGVMGLQPQWSDDGALLGTSRHSSPAVDRIYEAAALSEADARVRLARLGQDAIENFRKAVQLSDIISGWLSPGSPDHRNCLVLEAAACRGLADLKVDPEANWQRAIDAWQHLGESARDATVGSLETAGYRKNMADAGVRLADLGVEPEKNLAAAAEGYARAQEGFGLDHPEYELCLLSEVRTRAELAKRGERPAENLQQALGILTETRQPSGRGKPRYGEKLNLEASLRIELARLGGNAGEHLNEALRLCVEARDSSPEGSADHTAAQTQAAAARLQLALLGGKHELE